MSDLPDRDPSEPVEEAHTEVEVIPHPPASTDRGLARRIALQVLYEVDAVHHEVGKVIAVHLQARQISRKAARYVQWLATGVMRHLPALDAVIYQFAPEWRPEQMAFIDRNILRMAIYEFAISGRAPVGAAIDEAVLLARLFGAEGATNFVNGVLGALADDAETMKRLRAESGDQES